MILREFAGILWSNNSLNRQSSSMKKALRQIIAEVVWLVLSLGITILIVLLLSNLSFAEETIDIHIHDTMYVMNRWHILMPTYLLVTFLIYFIKEFRNLFSRNFPNTLLIIAGFACVISLTWLIKMLSPLGGGWTIYPPLSALGENYPVVTHDPATKFILNFLAIVQMVVLFFLLFVIYRWGKQRSGVPKD